MVNYRRNKLDSEDAVYFLTLVTSDRRKCFRCRDDYLVLWLAMERMVERFRVVFEAWVLLPDHVHWLLSPRAADYSKVVLAFKRGVGLEFKQRGQLSEGQSLWQNRFWEHTIRDDEDYARCADYIHYNPVKHGFVSSTQEWPYSTFARYVKRGIYPLDWGGGKATIIAGSEYDE